MDEKASLAGLEKRLCLQSQESTSSGVKDTPRNGDEDGESVNAFDRPDHGGANCEEQVSTYPRNVSGS